MKYQAALVRETGKAFAVVQVEKTAMRNRAEAERVAAAFERVFLGVPVVVMAENPGGRPIYLGRPDIVKHLAASGVARLKWQEHTVA